MCWCKEAVLEGLQGVRAKERCFGRRKRVRVRKRLGKNEMLE